MKGRGTYKPKLRNVLELLTISGEDPLPTFHVWPRRRRWVLLETSLLVAFSLNGTCQDQGLALVRIW